MQKHVNLKHVALLLGLLLTAVWCGASEIGLKDGFSNISIKEGNVQDLPRGSTIQAYIFGHILTVAFTESLGQIDIEIATTSGVSVEHTSTPTPNGVQVYIPNTGDYIITFVLPNGDEYYGEFTVTD